MTMTRCLCSLMVILLTCAQSSAKGGNYHTEDRYNPQHIDNLPPEIRNSILHRCSTPKALHPFAGYFDNFKRRDERTRSATAVLLSYYLQKSLNRSWLNSV